MHPPGSSHVPRAQNTALRKQALSRLGSLASSLHGTGRVVAGFFGKVASHLTLSVATGAGSITRSFGAPADADAFASLLAGANAGTTPSTTSASSFNLSLGKALEIGLETAGEADIEAEDLGLAVGAEAALAPEPPALPQLLDSLANIAQSLAAGQSPAGDDLGAASTALSRLADQLGISLSTPAQPATGGEPASDFAQQLANALAPLADQLLGSDAAEGGPELGQKLAALLAGLKQAGPGLDQQTLAAGAAALEDALAKLTRATPGAPPADPAAPAASTATPLTPTTPTAPTLAQPSIEPDPALGTDSQPTAETDAKLAPAAAEPPLDAAAAKSLPSALNRAEVAAAALRPVQPGYQTTQQQLNLPQLAFELVHQANAGNSHFQIRLDPPELGRIEVKLEFDAAGQVNARLIVDKSETLDLMQRDQRGLERALQQAGLDASKTNLEFSLRQNPSPGDGRQGNGQEQERRGSFGGGPSGGDADPLPLPSVNLYRGSLAAGGVNIIA
nr:flagellar hook-length control protein FliK [Devosia sp. 1635]